MAQLPTIDILLATCNGAEYIESQLESLIEQTYQNIRILVADDASTDDTLEIVEKFQRRDSRIIICDTCRKRGSAKRNFLFLLEKAESDLLMFCDQDDVWSKTKVEDTLKLMLSGEWIDKPRLVYSDMKVVDGNLKVINDSFLRSSRIPIGFYDLNSVAVQNIGAGCTMMLNKPLVCLARRQVDVEKIVMHDWWVAMIAAAFGSIGFLNSATVLYRQHERNSVGAVTYSVVKNAVNIRRMVNRIELARRQAEEFQKVFEDSLTERQKRDLESFHEIAYLPLAVRIPRILFHCKVWKKGVARKVGQAVSLVLLDGKRKRK